MSQSEEFVAVLSSADVDAAGLTPTGVQSSRLLFIGRDFSQTDILSALPA